MEAPGALLSLPGQPSVLTKLLYLQIIVHFSGELDIVELVSLSYVYFTGHVS